MLLSVCLQHPHIWLHFLHCMLSSMQLSMHKILFRAALTACQTWQLLVLHLFLLLSCVYRKLGMSFSSFHYPVSTARAETFQDGLCCIASVVCNRVALLKYDKFHFCCFLDVVLDNFSCSTDLWSVNVQSLHFAASIHVTHVHIRLGTSALEHQTSEFWILGWDLLYLIMR